MLFHAWCNVIIISNCLLSWLRRCDENMESPMVHSLRWWAASVLQISGRLVWNRCNHRSSHLHSRAGPCCLWSQGLGCGLAVRCDEGVLFCCVSTREDCVLVRQFERRMQVGVCAQTLVPSEASRLLQLDQCSTSSHALWRHALGNFVHVSQMPISLVPICLYCM